MTYNDQAVHLPKERSRARNDVEVFNHECKAVVETKSRV